MGEGRGGKVGGEQRETVRDSVAQRTCATESAGEKREMDQNKANLAWCTSGMNTQPYICNINK